MSDADFGRDRDRIADVAIDRAVREIMSAEAGPAFRQRVMTRILSEPAGPPRRWLPQLALAAAALAVMVVAVAWPKQETAIEPATTSAALTPQSPATASAPAPPTPTAAPPASPSRAATTTTTTERTAARPAAATITRSRVPEPPRGMVEAASVENAADTGVAAAIGAVDAAPDVSPLPSAAPGSLSLHAIPFAPIVISEIVIEPLRAGGR